ncbi:MAG: class II fructose-bisphosphate aldolase, partial [Patescibacteria group bacterium]
MKSLREIVAEFQKEKKALGHFNVSDSNQLEALAQAAKETGLPVIAGLSEGEREFFPLSHARSLVDDYIKEGIIMYLNADHTYSLEKVKAAIDAGVDSVVVDGAQLSYSDNVALTKASVAYAQAVGASTERDIIIEGELGYIGTSSKVLSALPEGVQVTEEMMTKPQEAQRFVQETGIDMLAPAVGNVHGMVRGGNPKLDIE